MEQETNKQQHTLDTINELSNAFGTMIEHNKEQVLTSSSFNGKFPRTYNQREAADATDCHPRKLTQLCNELDINPNTEGNKWKINIHDIYKIRQAIVTPLFKRSPEQKLQIFTTSQLKGGAGKTVATVTLATGLATELNNNYRIGVIDLDTQGTASMFLKPNLDDDDLSVGDLLMEKYELEAGETFATVCKEAFYPTNVPNLRVLCCRASDREYEYQAITSQYEATQQKSSYNAYDGLKEIIDAVEDEFDIILIDTAPQFSALTIAGHYVANSLIIPMRPSENDRDSSKKYFEFLAKMYKLLIGLGHPGMDSVRLLITAIRANSRAQTRMAQAIRRACKPSNIFTHELFESDAVINCAEDFCTVFDMSASEYPVTKSSLRLAQQGYTNILLELETLILANWGETNE